MNTTFHFTSAQEVSPAILEAIRQAYQEQPINIYIEPDKSVISDWEMQELKRREQIFLEPDDDFRRAITMDELEKSLLEHIDKLYAGK